MRLGMENGGSLLPSYTPECHQLANRRPILIRVVYEVHNCKCLIVVYCAISWKSNGSYFSYNKNVKTENHQRMLWYFVFARFEKYFQDLVFHPDGASPHFSFIKNLYLARKLGSSWIERPGLAAWLLCSADRSHCDLFPKHNDTFCI